MSHLFHTKNTHLNAGFVYLHLRRRRRGEWRQVMVGTWSADARSSAPHFRSHKFGFKTWVTSSDGVSARHRVPGSKRWVALDVGKS